MIVSLDEAVRWAKERGFSFVPPAPVPMRTATEKDRTARMTVLSWHQPGARAQNLFTHVRHRRQDALGPWAGRPAVTWQTDDLGNHLRLSTFDAPFQRCEALVDRIVESGTLQIQDSEIEYALEPHPRRHWAYRDRLQADVSVVSPFSQHSAEITEYWCLSPEPSRLWTELLASSDDNTLPNIPRLRFPLEHRMERIGNVMISRAEDAVSFRLGACHDNTLRFRVDAEVLPPDSYRAMVWASHSGDDVLRREIPVMLGTTEINLATDVDRIGFSVCRATDGQCIDLKESVLVKEINMRINLDAAPVLHIRDRQGQLIQTVKKPAVQSPVDVRLDKNSADLDKGIRRLWLDRQLHDREAVARRERNVVRFGPEDFGQAVEHFVSLLLRESDSQDPIYLADPYFMNYLKVRDGHKMYLRVFNATADRTLNVLCADADVARAAPWWSSYPEDLTRHVHVRSFVRQADKRPGFHDRYLITPERETVITHSFKGWYTDGVTFASHPYGVYRAEARRLWMMDVGSTKTPLLVREIT